MGGLTMTQEELKKKSNSELIALLFQKNANLTTIRRNLHDNEFIENSRIKHELEEMFEYEEKEYSALLQEVFRRMEHKK